MFYKFLLKIHIVFLSILKHKNSITFVYLSIVIQPSS